MKEIKGDLFEQHDADAICITTNGIVKKDGCAVMGKGVALEATKRFPGIAQSLGELLKINGNHVHSVHRVYKDGAAGCIVLSFPTKHHWRDKSDIRLIKRSCLELIKIADNNKGLTKIVITRPGCGNGGLRWEEVKQEIEPLLDDRFYIISW